MGYFSLKDINNNGKPILYYQIYSSVNYKNNVKRRTPGKNSSITYQNMSRNNIMISLGPYCSIINERNLKLRAIEKAMNYFKKGKITKDDLNDIEFGFKITEREEKRLFEDFALIQLKRFIETKEIQKQLDRMIDADKEDADMKNQTHKQWAIKAYENELMKTKEEISNELGVGPNRTKNEYLKRKYKKYIKAFAEENTVLASAAEIKLSKLS